MPEWLESRVSLAEKVAWEFRKTFGCYPTNLSREEIANEVTYWDPFGVCVAPDEMPSFIDFVQARLVAENEKEKRK